MVPINEVSASYYNFPLSSSSSLQTLSISHIMLRNGSAVYKVTDSTMLTATWRIESTTKFPELENTKINCSKLSYSFQNSTTLCYSWSITEDIYTWLCFTKWSPKRPRSSKRSFIIPSAGMAAVLPPCMWRGWWGLLWWNNWRCGLLIKQRNLLSFVLHN